MGAIIILTGFPREYRIEYRWDEEEKEWHVTCPTFPQLDLRRPSFEMAVDHAELFIRKYWLVSYFDRHIFTFHHVPMVDEWTEEEDEFADPAKAEANADGGDGKWVCSLNDIRDSLSKKGVRKGISYSLLRL